jgi:alcohol dehydrogenase
MRAVVADRFGGDWTVVQHPSPSPDAGQVVIDVEASGVCYTDVHNLRNPAYGATFPRVPGHEVVGRVAAIGTDVRGFEIGDRVGVQWTQGTCHTCRWCLTAREEQCDTALRTGATIDGGHAEQMVAYADALERIPPELDPIEAAPVMCAGYTVYSALADAEVGPGDHVVVAGIGGLGHLAVQYARALGAHVTALSSTPEKRHILEDLGVEHVIAGFNQAQELRPRSVDVLLCCGNRLPTRELIRYMAPYGRIALCGVSDEDFTIGVTPAIFMKLRVFGSSHGPRGRLREALELHAKNGAQTLVETYPLDEAPRALERVAAGTARFRAVLTPAR